MAITLQSWKKLFFFALGLTLAAAFCMKWMENDLWVNDDKFTILGLELFYSKEKLQFILANLDAQTKLVLRYHLSFDFAFMAGVYPGIAALCIIARGKTRSKGLTRLFYLLAFLQLGAWAADILENYYLLKWIDQPVIGTEFGFYHFVVGFKWIVALVAVLAAIPVNLARRIRQ
jgi:hypothetical protein